MVRICPLVILLLGTSLTASRPWRRSPPTSTWSRTSDCQISRYSRGRSHPGYRWQLLRHDVAARGVQRARRSLQNDRGRRDASGRRHDAALVSARTSTAARRAPTSFRAATASCTASRPGGVGRPARPRARFSESPSTERLSTCTRSVGAPSTAGVPSGGVVQASDGNYYGTTQSSDLEDSRRLACSACCSLLEEALLPSGFNTISGLVEGADGRLYGNGNSIFAIDLAGNFQVLHVPTAADGISQGGELIQASDGAFYGHRASGWGIPGHYGAVRPNQLRDGLPIRPVDRCVHGALVSFDGGAHGREPYRGSGRGRGRIPLWDDLRGRPGFGTIFRISKAGALTTLHTFDRVHGEGPMCGVDRDVTRCVLRDHPLRAEVQAPAHRGLCSG